MFLTTDEIGRGLSGSVRLLQKDHAGLAQFDVSLGGFWRSFAAIALAAPALVIFVARARLEEGAASGVEMDASSLLLHETIPFALSWIAFPIAMIGFVRLMGLQRRYVPFVVAYNWTSVVAVGILSVPSLLRVVGLATPSLALLFAAGFGIIVAHYRWFMARAVLGISGGLAAVVVAYDVAVTGVVATLFSAIV
jgi:hypothetical protein